jgi:hypothetical protein
VVKHQRFQPVSTIRANSRNSRRKFQNVSFLLSGPPAPLQIFLDPAQEILKLTQRTSDWSEFIQAGDSPGAGMV